MLQHWILGRSAILRVVFVVTAFPIVAVGQQTAIESSIKKLSSKHLPNLIRVHPQVFSGGQPVDKAAFEALRQLGVKTVISVDGNPPDLSLAKQFDMRYVHLPHGYDGISAERVFELAKAVRELEGPVYIHCHHGQHRSPAAAAAACVAADLLPASQAMNVLRIAGTNPNYRGLFRVVAQTQALPPVEMNARQVEFVERAPVPPLTAAMVALERQFDLLQQLAAADWRPLPPPRDVEGRQSALLLREHFAELLRSEDTARRSDAYRSWLVESQRLAERIEELIEPAALAKASSRDGLASAMQQISHNCRQCHAQFRDAR